MAYNLLSNKGNLKFMSYKDIQSIPWSQASPFEFNSKNRIREWQDKLKRTYKTKLSIAIAVAFIGGVLLTLSLQKAPNFFQAAEVAAPAVVETETKPAIPELNKENLLRVLQEEGVFCAEVVLAQAQVESGLLTAGNSSKINNLFGMRYPSRRQTTAIGLYFQGKDSVVLGTQKELRKHLNKPTYAVYDNWVDAVKDYKIWQDFSFKAESKYIDFLQRVYATEPTYGETLAKMTQ